MTIDTTKVCTACERELPLAAFGRKRDGHNAQCKGCRNADAKRHRELNRDEINARHRAFHAVNRDEQNAKRRAHHAAHPDQKRSRDLMVLYGLTVEQYDEMLARQGGVCAVCGNAETRTRDGVVRALTVDHDHETGRVRGLLCASCNSVIGLADDDPDRLRCAAAYLEEADL